MDAYNPTSDDYDDLFDGEPDYPNFTPPQPETSVSGAHNEEDALAMSGRTSTVSEGQKAPSHRQPGKLYQPLNAGSSTIKQSKDEVDAAWTMFDEAVAGNEDLETEPAIPVATSRYQWPKGVLGDAIENELWRSANESIEYYDDNGELFSSDLPSRSNGNISPTETELIEDGFEFHNMLSEQKIVEKFNKKHFLQALKAIDPSLSRKVQWKAWRAAQDKHLFLGDGDGDESETSNIDLNNSFEDNIPPCDVENEVTESSKWKVNTWESRTNPFIGDRQPSTDLESVVSDTARSMIRSKPHLAELMPQDTQGHHPCIIVRSPKRQPSRASSLAGSISFDMESETPDPQPLTKEALSATDEANVTGSGIHRDVPSPAKTEPLHSLPSISRPSSPFRKPMEPASFTTPGRSSPLRRPIDLIDVGSTRAVRGSPVRLCDTVSRPDTPRPLFSEVTVRESIEHGLPIGPWTSYRSAIQAGRSHSPSPASTGGNRSVCTSLSNSPAFVKSDSPTTGTIAAVSLMLQADHSSLEAEAYQPLANTSRNHLSVPQLRSFTSDPGPIIQRPTASRGVSAGTETLFTVTQTLRRISAADLRNNVESNLAQTLNCRQEAEPVPSVTEAEPQKQPPQLLEPWQEPPRIADNLIDRKPPIHTPTSPSQPGTGRQLRPRSRTPARQASDPFAPQSDNIQIPMPDSPPAGPLSSIAEALTQAKRGQRNATATKSTRGTARSVTVKRTTSTKTKSPAKRTVTGKATAPAAAGVQGDNVKIGKPKPRSTSRKAINTGRITRPKAETTPEVPPLPEPDKMDIDRDIGTALSTQLAALDQSIAAIATTIQTTEQQQPPQQQQQQQQTSVKLTTERHRHPSSPPPNQEQSIPPSITRTPTRKRTLTATPAPTPKRTPKSRKRTPKPRNPATPRRRASTPTPKPTPAAVRQSPRKATPSRRKRQADVDVWR